MFFVYYIMINSTSKKKKKKNAYIQENLIRDVSLSMFKHQQEKQYLCLSESFS